MARHEIVADREAAIEFCRPYFQVGDDSSIKGICLLRDGQVIAATLYHDYNGANIWAHITGTPGARWLTREYLFEIFAYPFRQLGVKRVSLWIETNNLSSRQFAEKLGFVHEATLRGAGRGGLDATIYCMFREWCRWA